MVKVLAWAPKVALVILYFLLADANIFGQSSCPDPDRYGIECAGLCGSTGSCVYTETFQTDFTGNGKYVRIIAFANNVEVHSECLGPLPGTTTQYSVTFSAPCDASIYVLYSAYTNSSSQNPCGGTICESGFCAYDTCQEGIYLPITLESFTARQSDQIIDLIWTTLSEINNDHFELEKSMDGLIWEFFSRISAKGQEVGRTNYHLVDHYPFAGNNFYRLIQVDLDGTRHHQGIVLVRNYAKFMTYQSEDRCIQYSSLAESSLNLNLIDFRGQVIDQMTLSPGEIKYLPADLPSGLYLLQYIGSNSSNIMKLFLEG